MNTIVKYPIIVKIKKEIQFANGNGRHARFSADALLLSLNQPRFTWGKNSLSTNSQIRKP